jgi:hypothetical protein
MWISQKVSGKMFYNLFCVGYIFFGGNTVCNLWFGGQIALKIRLIMWKNDATVQIQIILCCFETVRARDLLTHPHADCTTAVHLSI